MLYLLIMAVNEFCEMVRQRRLEKYKSAKEFYRIKSVTCTYAYYSKVESGSLPDIALVLELIDKLELNIRKALYAWTRDQMPSTELKAHFAELDDGPSLSTEQQSLDRSLVINRMQAGMLLKNGVYWELMMYFSSHFGKKIPHIKEISKLFCMSAEKMQKMCEELYTFGLLDKNTHGNFVSKEWIFVPYDEEFKPLRDLNFKRAFEQFRKSEENNQFRTTVTTLLTPRHQAVIESKVYALTNYIIDLSEKEQSQDSIPYTVGVFSSPRVFGND